MGIILTHRNFVLLQAHDVCCLLTFATCMPSCNKADPIRKQQLLRLCFCGERAAESIPFEYFFPPPFVLYSLYLFLWPTLQMTWPFSSIPFFLFFSFLFISFQLLFFSALVLSLKYTHICIFSLYFYLNSSGNSFMVIIFSTLYTLFYYLLIFFRTHARGCILSSLYFIVIYFLPCACKVLQLFFSYHLLIFFLLLFLHYSLCPKKYVILGILEQTNKNVK